MPPTAPSSTDDQPELGLRERKKRLTRRTIAESAFELSLERGLDAVTIDQIAQRAFVSPRTVSNYFPSKEAAVLAVDGSAPLELLQGAESRPVDEPPLQALRETLVTHMRDLSEADARVLRRREELIDRHPALQLQRAAQYDAFEAAVRALVAQRTGLDAEADRYPRLVAGAASTGVKTAMRMWVQGGGGASEIADLIDQAFRDLEAGLGPVE
jgi:AcrR family transcriptional regulator